MRYRLGGVYRHARSFSHPHDHDETDLPEISMLLRLTYASRIADDFDENEIDRIVERSNVANAERGITGIIAFDGRKIIQILEGPAENVEALFERIARDRRHEGVVELQRFEIGRTSFENWRMMRRPIAEVYLMAESFGARQGDRKG